MLTAYQSLLVDFTPRPIKSKREYKRVLKYLDQNMAPHSPRDKAQLLDLLAALAADYEEQRFPLLDLNPGELLKFLINERGITRAELARQTGIPRQKITNAITGTR